MQSERPVVSAAWSLSFLVVPRPDSSTTMPMKGCFLICHTLQYLGRGRWYSRSVKVMTVNYNMHEELGEGTRIFVVFNISKILYKKPWVQIMMFKNMMPSPFLWFYLHSRE